MKIPVEIQKEFGPSETAELFIDQNDYPQITVDSLAVTNERIFIRHAGAPESRAGLAIYRYPEIVGVGLEKGFMRSILRLKVTNAEKSMESIRLPPRLDEQALEIIKRKVCGQPAPNVL